MWCGPLESVYQVSRAVLNKSVNMDAVGDRMKGTHSV